ncbi:hypothetical protein E2C01_014121 [Portunus trituberculatus]|uniref:Uncharacterized protein n=1 Tax=Portunus trituberculatus TaxID=210409 RepID=A0A5B7DJ33_PORTR|nr:hypothetical protein [Portunus trituberculatus]
MSDTCAKRVPEQPPLPTTRDLPAKVLRESLGCGGWHPPRRLPGVGGGEERACSGSSSSSGMNFDWSSHYA